MAVRLVSEKPGYVMLNVGHAAAVRSASEVGSGAGNANDVINGLVADAFISVLTTLYAPWAFMVWAYALAINE